MGIKENNLESLKCNFDKEAGCDPQKLKQYEEEAELIRKELCKVQVNDGNVRSIVFDAVISVAQNRVKHIKKELKEQGIHSWACGTDASNRKKAFKKALDILYSDEELLALIRNCADSEELGPDDKQTLLLLVHIAPTPHLNIDYTD